MRLLAIFAGLSLAWANPGKAQPADPAYAPLTRAYTALSAGDYDPAIAAFLQAITASPTRPDIRKDLAYAYLKIGENLLARDQFRQAMQLEPADTQVAMEYAFLCFETKEQAQARRIFDRIRKTPHRPGLNDGGPSKTAEQAFQNIDGPLADGIERWTQAIAKGGANFSAHFELATLAEQRDQLPLAAEHYEKAWHLLPDRRSVLVDLGRVWLALNRLDDAHAALLAASLGGEPRAAELARELLPDHYPYVDDFRRALLLDPDNTELHRELGYLLLRMDFPLEAEQEFRALTELAPDELLAATQLGFLLYGRGEQAAAQPLFERVLSGKDEDLANRVRAVLRLPQLVKARTAAQPQSIDAKVMAERSIKAGYMKDALKYLQVAHEADPGDFAVMLKLGWTYNILHQDVLAFRWFDLARKSPDPQIATEAATAWHSLRAGTERFRTTAWLFPIFSTRWHDLFTYGQVKTEIRTGFPIHPYISVRFVGDTRQTAGIAGQTAGTAAPQYLSESAFIAGVGIATDPWHGITAWAEAGNSIGYLTRHMLPDYRGGVSIARAWRSESTNWFADTTIDAVYFSRFGNDVLAYAQNRLGYTAGPPELRTQLYWNANATIDSKRQDWANFFETGPGLRFTSSRMPKSMYLTVNALRGAHLIDARPHFTDLRTGLWYAITH
jgi:Flp pilus assembly protein TadD